jgi:hypothetical protein
MSSARPESEHGRHGFSFTWKRVFAVHVLTATTEGWIERFLFLGNRGMPVWKSRLVRNWLRRRANGLAKHTPRICSRLACKKHGLNYARDPPFVSCGGVSVSSRTSRLNSVAFFDPSTESTNPRGRPERSLFGIPSRVNSPQTASPSSHPSTILPHFSRLIIYSSRTPYSINFPQTIKSSNSLLFSWRQRHHVVRWHQRGHVHWWIMKPFAISPTTSWVPGSQCSSSGADRQNHRVMAFTYFIYNRDNGVLVPPSTQVLPCLSTRSFASGTHPSRHLPWTVPCRIRSICLPRHQIRTQADAFRTCYTD